MRLYSSIKWILLSALLTAPTVQADPLKAINDPRMDWYKDAKFGLMIHWGMYAVPAGYWSKDKTFDSWLNADESELEPIGGYAEQIMKNAQMRPEEYNRIAEVFDWSKWNAQDIIDLCYATGQRYIVITSKHHDGFAMYHSQASKFNIVDATPYGRKTGRDPLKELADACHATETDGSPWPIKMCFYYSHCVDWQEDGTHPHNYQYVKGPDAELFKPYFENKFFPQVKELMHNYGDVGLIWFDVPRVPFSVEQAKQVVDMMREAQPATLVNGRLGKDEFIDYRVSGDNGVAGVPTDYYWETPSSINHTYGYGKGDTDWRSWEELADLLVRCVSHNGNYLLNIGPKGDGTIPEKSVEILHDLGRWVKPNSEAIFGSDATPYRGEMMTSMDWGYCTQKDNVLYLFVKNWPKDGKVALPLIRNEVKKVSFLIAADQAALDHERSVDARGNRVVIIKVPKTAPVEKGMVVIKAELEGKAALDPVKHFYDDTRKQIVLEARDFHAITGPKTKIYYDREMDALHNFFAKGGDAPVWTFDVPESGEYSIAILYSAHRNLARDKKNDIHLDGKPVLSFATLATKGASQDPWCNFEDHVVGKMSMEKGRRNLAIVPQPKQDGRNMSIKRVTLTKVDR
jgi:alpha-L-fucosidase